MPRPVRSVSALVLVFAGFLAACSDQAEEPARVVGSFVPVDDGASDPGFVAFRDSLRAVVARRDTAALVAAVGPGARLSFGDDAGGPEGLCAMWFTGRPPGGVPLWDVLDRLLSAGSVLEDGAVTVPYAFGAWPDSVDAFSHVAVVGEDVPATTAPSDTARVVALVTHSILPVSGPAADGYQQVRLPGGAEAYVPAAAAMSPVGYRATFWDEGDGWKLHFLVAGD